MLSFYIHVLELTRLGSVANVYALHDYPTSGSV